MAQPSAGPAPASSPPGIPRTLVLVGTTSFLTDLSSEMVYPLLPMLVVGSLGASVTVLGVIEGLAESVPALTKVLAGHVSDRVGRRKPLAIAGYACSTIGKLLLAIAAGPVTVVAGRVTDRFGKGIRGAPRDALIADATPPGPARSRVRLPPHDGHGRCGAGRARRVPSSDPRIR